MTASLKLTAVPTEAPPVVRDLQSYIGRLCATPVPIDIDPVLLAKAELQRGVVAIMRATFPGCDLEQWELRSIYAPRAYAVTAEDLARFFIAERNRKVTS